jgi:hypothetical protein
MLAPTLTYFAISVPAAITKPTYETFKTDFAAPIGPILAVNILGLVREYRVPGKYGMVVAQSGRSITMAIDQDHGRAMPLGLAPILSAVV